VSEVITEISPFLPTLSQK